ncbi:MAG: hypothetical protein RO469_14870 [Thermincola sp.]|nr:hypothetical protein [Thermincola sp.]MDT3703943.1 hypothetical protein [Thermincola sp.]
MFPYTHICFAKDVLGDLTNEIVLGAVFPDTIIAGFIEHSETHRRCAQLYSYLSRVGLFQNFAKGAITHGSAPQGLDYYCDEKYLDFSHGFAFQQALPLVEKVIKACNLPEEMGLWKAHNFIEMSAELWMYNNRTDCYGYLAKALDDQNLILDLSELLAPFFDVPIGKIAMSLPIYGEYVLLGEVTAPKLAEKYSLQTKKKHGINIDIAAAAEIIEEGLLIVDNTLPEFMTFSVTEVKKLFSV